MMETLLEHGNAVENENGFEACGGEGRGIVVDGAFCKDENVVVLLI